MKLSHSRLQGLTLVVFVCGLHGCGGGDSNGATSEGLNDAGADTFAAAGGPDGGSGPSLSEDGADAPTGQGLSEAEADAPAGQGLSEAGADDAAPNEQGSPDAGADDAGSTGRITMDAESDARASGPSSGASVTVNPAMQVGVVGPGFAGLSFEKSHLNTGYFTSTNSDLIGLFRLLGPSVLRIGGNTVDQTTWSSTGTGQTVGVIGPPDVDALAGFLRATGWTVIYGVNMAANDASAAASEAAYVAKAVGAGLYGFEIGNEPDLYHSNGIRTTTFTYADFLSQWETLYAAMHTSAPAALFTGPATATNYAGYTEPFSKDASALIVLSTQHYYRGDGKSASSTLAELLAPDPALITELGALSKAATTNGISRGYRMSECNTFFHGGAPGVSNGYGTALWTIDYLFTLAVHGSTGANFHGGGNGTGYTPIADLNSVVVEARPDYYGMLLFTLAGQGRVFATTITGTKVNFTAYALGVADGSTSVVLVNKDAAETVHATIDLGKTATSAALTVLTGPSLGATAGITIGGASIPKDGSWSPSSEPSAPVTGSTVVADVPPASAVLVHAK